MVRIKIVFLFGIILGTHLPDSNQDSSMIQDEDIDFTIQDSKDHLKYKYVLIAFRRIMESKAKRTGLYGQVQNVVSRLYSDKPTEEQILSDEINFDGLMTLAEKLLKSYKHVFLGSADYPTKAYQYRILQWLQISMRRQSNINQSFESAISKILQSTDKNENPPKNILQDIHIFPKWDIEQQCRDIKNFKELQEFGAIEDQIVHFCLMLGEQVQTVVKDTTITMPFYKNIELYENFINDMKSTFTRFRAYFRKYPLEILVHIYEAARVRLGITYERKDGQDIKLHHPDAVYIDPMKYLCDVMTLYDHAIEHLFPKKPEGWFSYYAQTEITADQIIQMENFHSEMNVFSQLVGDLNVSSIDKRKFKELRMSVLEELITKIRSNYDERIQNLVNKQQWFDDSKLYYGRLLGWLAAYIGKIRGAKSQIECALKEFRKSEQVGSHFRELERNLEDETYLEVTTLTALISFCKNGKDSISLYDAVDGNNAPAQP